MTTLSSWTGNLLVCTTAIVALGAPFAMLVAKHAPVAGQPVVAFSAPWHDISQIATRASAQVIGPGRSRFVGLVYSSDPQFQTNLKAAGAWLLLDGDLSEIFCTI